MRPLVEVRVYSRTAERREEFAARVTREIGVPARAVAEPAEAVRGADIVVTATTSSRPVLLGEWLEAGCTSMRSGERGHAPRTGRSRGPPRRPHCGGFARAVALESGELLAVPRWDEVVELAQVVAGKIPGRRTAGEVTLFKSNGIALEDVVVAGWLYEQSSGHGFNRADGRSQSTGFSR